jgi:hypothetical protein
MCYSCSSYGVAEKGTSYAMLNSNILSPSDYGYGFGYQLSTTLSAELSYLTIRDLQVVGSTNRYNVSGCNFGLVGYYPVANSISLVGKVGEFIHTSDSSTLPSQYNNTTIATALGIQYETSQTITLMLLLESFGTLKSSKTDMGWKYSQITGGVRYNF